MTAGKPEIDYIGMSAPLVLGTLGDDASLWAAAFVQHAKMVQARGDACNRLNG